MLPDNYQNGYRPAKWVARPHAGDLPSLHISEGETGGMANQRQPRRMGNSLAVTTNSQWLGLADCIRKTVYYMAGGVRLVGKF